jgi:2-polyprenyl-3-methyl-5-hydroxy-6-metoxy-1,4-benzoquinol methylase
MQSLLGLGANSRYAAQMWETAQSSFSLGFRYLDFSADAMRERSLVPELMDDPELERVEHLRALSGLGRINRWTRMAALAWRPIAELAKSRSCRQLKVLDVATGGGDLPLQLLSLARKCGISLDMHACDISPLAIQHVARRSHQAGEEIHVWKSDVLNDDLVGQYDVVVCSQFLHHLTAREAVKLMRKMRAVARHRVVVVDLIRSRLNWVQVCFATRVLTRSPIVHVDGPRSVRAAFQVKEIEDIARQVDFRRVAITSHWPCRFLLVGDIHDGH